VFEALDSDLRAYGAVEAVEEAMEGRRGVIVDGPPSEGLPARDDRENALVPDGVRGA
jgi:hypothetical protein